jgi:hypothetical protein
MISCIERKENYSEIIRSLKEVDTIEIKDIFYKLDCISFEPAESEEFIDAIDVFLKMEQV